VCALVCGWFSFLCCCCCGSSFSSSHARVVLHMLSGLLSIHPIPFLFLGLVFFPSVLTYVLHFPCSFSVSYVCISVVAKCSPEYGGFSMHARHRLLGIAGSGPGASIVKFRHRVRLPAPVATPDIIASQERSRLMPLSPAHLACTHLIPSSHPELILHHHHPPYVPLIHVTLLCTQSSAANVHGTGTSAPSNTLSSFFFLLSRSLSYCVPSIRLTLCTTTHHHGPSVALAST